MEPELSSIERSERPARADEIGERALFDDPTLAQNNNPIGLPYRREPVRDDKSGAAGHQPIQSFHNERFGFRVQ
jgi:hypothetical protein